MNAINSLVEKIQGVLQDALTKCNLPLLTSGEHVYVLMEDGRIFSVEINVRLRPGQFTAEE
jgi:hypothetical protein